MKKKVLLVFPAYKMEKTSKKVLRYHPPMGLLNLASFLLLQGYECEIVNTAFQDIDWEKIKNGSYFLVGFTVIIGEFLKNAKALSAKVKEVNPSLSVCFGGIMASLFPEQILKEYNVDFVVRYEGEHTLFELCQFLNGTGSLKDIRGLSYKERDKIIHNPPRFLENNLDNFSIPKWDLFNENCNRQQVPYFFNIFSSKGCPYQCNFCYKYSVDKEIRDKSPSWRYRSSKHIISEIEYIYHLTESPVFTFGDDNFLVKKDRAKEVINYIKTSKFYIEQLVSHLNHLTDEIIDAMGGVVQTVIYAVESASPRLQRLLNKNLDLSKIPSVNKKLFDKGITTTHNFMIGLPTETDQDLRNNIELAMHLKKINPYVRMVTYLYLPLPFTPLCSYIEKEMGMSLPLTLKDCEDANLDAGSKEGMKFRPWLSQERYEFLRDYSAIFEDAFQINNLHLSEQSQDLLKSNSWLRELFMGIEEVARPKIFNRPYVLDRVLNNENVDLLNDLRILVP